MLVYTQFMVTAIKKKDMTSGKKSSHRRVKLLF